MRYGGSSVKIRIWGNRSGCAWRQRRFSIYRCVHVFISYILAFGDRSFHPYRTHLAGLTSSLFIGSLSFDKLDDHFSLNFLLTYNLNKGKL